MNPLNGAIPVPGPIMITGTEGLKGRRNWDLRTKMGTVGQCPLTGSLVLSQLVATPFECFLVGVIHSVRMAVMWIDVAWTCTGGKTEIIISDRSLITGEGGGGGGQPTKWKKSSPLKMLGVKVTSKLYCAPPSAWLKLFPPPPHFVGVKLDLASLSFRFVAHPLRFGYQSLTWK